MNRRGLIVIPFACLLSLAFTCNERIPAPNSKISSQFHDYWFSGQAELNRYKLTQARYGAQHSGEAVLVFVTEPFLKKKQVKLESKWRKGATNVLKLNSMRRFSTGIYDYSMMSSAFVPVNENPGNHALKLTTSSQDWCGHTWFQLNRRSDRYDIRSFSYFQNQGDQDFSLPVAHLENEAVVKMRFSADMVPTGNTRMLPSAKYLRLTHKEAKAYQVNATLETVTNSTFAPEPLLKYTLFYPELKREISYFYKQKFPRELVGWEEQYPFPMGDKDKMAKTIAVRTDIVRKPYWKLNQPKDAGLRRELGISGFE